MFAYQRVSLCFCMFSEHEEILIGPDESVPMLSSYSAESPENCDEPNDKNQVEIEIENECDVFIVQPVNVIQ